MTDKVFVLAFEYLDKSAFYLCGVTANYKVAEAWYKAGNGEHKVYDLTMEAIADHTIGFPSWKRAEVAR